MRTLRLGSENDDVRLWEAFLRGKELFFEEADGKFDSATHEATKEFQSSNGLVGDGVVGPMTWAKAIQQGVDVVEDDDLTEASPNWPPKPAFGPLDYQDRQNVFTPFHFSPAGVAGNPEAIRIHGDWVSQNIVKVEVPQLAGIRGTGGRTEFHFHRLVQHQLAGLFALWERDGLLDLVKSWAGSWVPRFVRGSRTYLSNHSFGSAFDINAPWNGLGRTPALVGKTGSVRKLVPAANRLGFYWGGHFKRPDGMHFEVAQTMSKQQVEEVLSNPY